MNEGNRLKKVIKDLIYKVLHKEKLLVNQWRLGVVDTVVSSTQITAFIDGSTTSVTVPCNPDVTFVAGDHIYIIYNGGNQNDRFALCKRAI